MCLSEFLEWFFYEKNTDDFSRNLLIFYYLQVNPLFYYNTGEIWSGKQPRVVEAFQAAESSWTKQSSSVHKEVQSKCQSSKDSNQNQSEHLELDVNVLIKIIINRSTDMQDTYTVYTYKKVTVLIMSLTSTSAPEYSFEVLWHFLSFCLLFFYFYSLYFYFQDV